jgi:hypothetical protein
MLPENALCSVKRFYQKELLYVNTSTTLNKRDPAESEAENVVGRKKRSRARRTKISARNSQSNEWGKNLSYGMVVCFESPTAMTRSEYHTEITSSIAD